MCFYLCLILQLIQQHVYVHIAHRKYNLLMGFFITNQTQGRIDFGLLGKKSSQLVLVLLVFCFKSNGIERNWARQRINLNIAGKRERIASFRLVHFRNNDNIAGLSTFDIHWLLAHHHIEMRQAFFFLATCICKLHSRLKVSGKHLNETHASNIRIRKRLENKTSRFTRFINIKLIAISQVKGAMRTRMREITGDILHKTFNALLDDSRANEHRNENLLRNSLIEQLL